MLALNARALPGPSRGRARARAAGAGRHRREPRDRHRALGPRADAVRRRIRAASPTSSSVGSRSARCRSVHGPDDATAAASAGRREHAGGAGRSRDSCRARATRARSRATNCSARSWKRSWTRSVKCGATARPRRPRTANERRPSTPSPTPTGGRPLPPGPIRSARRPSSAFRNATSGLRSPPASGCSSLGVRPRRRGAALVCCRRRPTVVATAAGARRSRGERCPAHPGDALLRRRQRPGARAGQPAGALRRHAARAGAAHCRGRRRAGARRPALGDSGRARPCGRSFLPRTATRSSISAAPS